MLRIESAQRPAALFLLAFYLTGAFTFSIFTKNLGMLDVYWLYFSLLFFCVLEHKWLRFLIPLFYAASIMIHYAAVLNYIVLFSMVLLYRISIERDKKTCRAYWFIFTASIGVSLAFFLFFVLNERNMICSMEAFHQKLLSRGSDYFEYYDYAFYDVFKEKTFMPDKVYQIDSVPLRILATVFYRVKFNYEIALDLGSNFFIAFIGNLIFIFPVMCFLYRFYLRRFREQEKGLKRFFLFLMLVQFPFTFFVGMLFSVDINRWMPHTYLIHFTCLLYYLYHEKEQCSVFFDQLKPLSSSLPVQIYLLGYATINFWPYF